MRANVQQVASALAEGESMRRAVEESVQEGEPLRVLSSGRSQVEGVREQTCEAS